MENSKAYKSFLNQLNATGSEKMNGYDPELFEKIYDWERDDVEDKIWSLFCKSKDADLVNFLPQLKKYQGVSKLEETIKTCRQPSELSMNISIVLYQNSLEAAYLEIIKKNLELEPNNIAFISKLVNCRPDSNIYNLLVEIYVNSSDEVIRNTAVTGILHCKGIISNPSDLNELMNHIGLARKFAASDAATRKEIIEKFEKQEDEF